MALHGTVLCAKRARGDACDSIEISSAREEGEREKKDSLVSARGREARGKQTASGDGKNAAKFKGPESRFGPSGGEQTSKRGKIRLGRIRRRGERLAIRQKELKRERSISTN